MDLHVPPALRRGRLAGDEAASVASGARLISHLCDDIGLRDLGSVDVLDVGCGVKFTQALLNHQLPIRRYVGIDVSAEIIDYLQAAVDDPRFEYYHLDAHNERYNPNGRPLADVQLPLVGSFDVICLFSVFTHLAPHDYRAMLELVRPYATPAGRLFFTLFIDEISSTGDGLMDAWARKLGPQSVGTVDTFRDLDPAQPLLYAIYSRRFAHELIEGTGWEVLALRPPGPHLQHHFICGGR